MPAFAGMTVAVLPVVPRFQRTRLLFGRRYHCAKCQSMGGLNVDSFLAHLTDRAVEFYGERLVSLVVFGSFASGRAHKGSDLDLLIVLNDAAPRRQQRLTEF